MKRKIFQPFSEIFEKTIEKGEKVWYNTCCYGGIAQLVRVHAWHAWGRWFEFNCLHQKKAICECKWLFSTKFAFGEWNMASPCEIASLWNICSSNVRGEFYFTSNKAAGGVRYFKICVSILFHVLRQQNISLRCLLPECIPIRVHNWLRCIFVTNKRNRLHRNGSFFIIQKTNHRSANEWDFHGCILCVFRNLRDCV